MTKKATLHQYLPLGLILSLGLGVSTIAAIAIGRWEAWNDRMRFQRQIDNLTIVLQRNLDRYTDVVRSMGDFYTVNQAAIDQQQFARFVRRSLISYSGIQALEWAPRITEAERFTYEQAMQKRMPTFQITELATVAASEGKLIRASDRPDYFPVTFVEPWENNELALGYDLASNSIRRSALETARDTGEIAATGRVRLVQETRDQFGFLVFFPIYQTPSWSFDLSVTERRQLLKGLLLGVFRVSDVVEEAQQSLRYDINFSLYDRSANPREQYLGFYVAATKRVTTAERDRPSSPDPSAQNTLCPTASDCTRTLNVGRRQWAVVFSPSINYQGSYGYAAIAIFWMGFLITLSLTLLFSTLRTELHKTKELSELKLRLFSMASHELRTPLSTILLSAQSLATHDQVLTDHQKHKNLQRIQLAAKRMSQLIADILTLTRAEVGKLEFTPERLDINLFCSQLVDEVQADTVQKICLTCNGSQTTAWLDQKLLRSLLTNLLSNAIKYSSSSELIQLQVCCDATTVVLMVSDRGIGIAPPDQAHLYEPFYRGKNIGEVMGVGLGLSVVKTCVDLHQGTIDIHSQLHQGTTVTVRLPQHLKD